MPCRVAIVDTGVANVRSLLTAFDNLGFEGFVTNDPDTIRRGDYVVLPGVGSFGAAMARIDAFQLREAICGRIYDNLPTLAICLGMQLLGCASEENPGVAGLGVLPLTATRFSDRVSVPQLGWNSVCPQAAGPIPFGCAYFANSYRFASAPTGWRAATTDYGTSFVSALWRGDVLACQFHPELSGDWGESVLENWLRGESSEKPSRDLPRELLRRVIPCLDVSHGRVVKGVRFADLRDAGDPAELARRYQQQGADELVLLDVSATREDRGTMTETVARVRAELSIPLTVGGGVRSVDDAARLLRHGADKVSINSAAVARPELVSEIADQFGAQCTVVAIDAKRRDDGWHVMTRGGTQAESRNVLEWVEQVEWLGAGEILLTSHDRDGTGLGYDEALLQAVSQRCRLPVIASGGARRADDLAAALRAGAHAVLAASIFHDNALTINEVKSQLAAMGIRVRL